MKNLFEQFSDAAADYLVGTVIAVVLTALARRDARSRASKELSA